VTFLGYEDLFINDMLIASGKEIYIPVELQEKVILIPHTTDILHSGTLSWSIIN
jgi:hypothetical protein